MLLRVAAQATAYHPCKECQPVKPLCLLLQPPEASGDSKDKKKGDKGAKGKKK